jgi:3-hydroxyisobutyrate dehydrogenase
VLREARAGWAADAVLLQTSTVGVAGSAALADVAAELGLRYVDAPVQGTKRPAEQGRLVVLGSGPEDTRALLAPVLDAIGSRTLWLGPAGAGSRLKLATNAFVVNVTAALAESMTITAALGLEHATFLEAIAGGPLESPFVATKGQAIRAGDYTPSFAVDGGLKDTRLIATAAAEAGVEVRLTATTAVMLAALSAQGYGDDDIAALGRRATEGVS